MVYQIRASLISCTMSLFLFATAVGMELSLLENQHQEEKLPIARALRVTPPSQPARNPQSRYSIRSNMAGEERTIGCLGCAAGCTAGSLGVWASFMLVAIFSDTTEPLTPCTIPATINPEQQMTSCWSPCVAIGDNPILCDLNSYQPVNVTAKTVMSSLKAKYGGASQVCLLTYDCSDPIPYPENKALALAKRNEPSRREQAQLNKQKTPKHFFKDRKRK